MPTTGSFAFFEGFDGFHGLTTSISKTCLVWFDNKNYSVMASAVWRPALIRLMRIGSSCVRTAAKWVNSGPSVDGCGTRADGVEYDKPVVDGIAIHLRDAAKSFNIRPA